MAVSQKWKIPSTTRMNPSSFAKRKTPSIYIDLSPVEKKSFVLGVMAVEFDAVDHVAFPWLTGSLGLQCVGLQVALVNCLYIEVSKLDPGLPTDHTDFKFMWRNGGSTSHAAVSDDDEGGHLISFDHF